MAHRLINDVFERVVVLNLDRRRDRMVQVASQLQRLKVTFERFPAVDGQNEAVAAEWRRYAAQGLVTVPESMRQITTYREFYLDYESDLARIAFVETNQGQKAIATPGAWGLLKSMTTIIEKAIKEDWDSLLILEDDVVFHKDAAILFDRCMAQVPRDWRILQLGAMQLHWETDWISWYAENLYRCQGSSIGAHAVGLRREVLPMLLKRCHRCDLPFDIGALHTVKRRFAEQCLTMFPNLAIQDATDSEIGMSRIFFDQARKNDNVYRWHLPDYQSHDRVADDTGGTLMPTNGTEMSARRGMNPRAKRHRSKRTRRGLPSIGAYLTGLKGYADADERKPISPSPSATTSHARPPLRPLLQDRSTASTVLAVVLGLEGEHLTNVLDLLIRGAGSEVVPVVLTDSVDFHLFRERRLIFEYLPPETQRQRFAPNLDWQLYTLRRLALLRTKWQPIRIVAFGGAASVLVSAWKQSPFEDATISEIISGPLGPTPAQTSP